MCLRNLVIAVVVAWTLAGVSGHERLAICRGAEPTASTEPERDADGKIVPLHKTDAEWKKLLTRRQFEVARRGETESPFTGRYLHYRRPGTYRCACCDLEVFDSRAKFSSHTGWPSYFQPVEAD